MALVIFCVAFTEAMRFLRSFKDGIWRSHPVMADHKPTIHDLNLILAHHAVATAATWPAGQARP
jgi:hypothetical protein